MAPSTTNDRKQLAATLARVPLLARLSRKNLERLAAGLTERTFPAGSTIMAEGDAGVSFWLILDGEAKASRGGQQVNTLGPGDWMGEVALLTDRPRTATVVAETDVHCAGMAAWQFRSFVASDPEISWGLLQTLADYIAEDSSRR